MKRKIMDLVLGRPGMMRAQPGAEDGGPTFENCNIFKFSNVNLVISISIIITVHVNNKRKDHQRDGCGFYSL